MKKTIKFSSSAFEKLQEATKKAEISFGSFETAISKAFPKKAKKEKSIKDKISDLNVEICEVLFEKANVLQRNYLFFADNRREGETLQRKNGKIDNRKNKWRLEF